MQMEEVMNIQEIQARLDRMAVAMGEKGIKTPEARLSVESGDDSPRLYLCKADPKYSSGRITTIFQYIRDGALAEKLDAADAIIAALPSPEEARRNEFMSALGKVIDLGRENGIDLEYLNPLSATMKRLSENALTDQRAA
jgi:hypothetical protein